MDIQNYQAPEDDVDFQLNFQGRGQKGLHLEKTVAKQVQKITDSSQIKCLYNKNLDPQNKSITTAAQISYSDLQLSHYFMKNKYKDQRIEIFNDLRELLDSRGYSDIGKISDKLQEQIMVIRVIGIIQGKLNTVEIEDQTARAILQIKQGFLWVGMICAIRVKYSQGMYRLYKNSDIIDLSTPVNKSVPKLRADMASHRILFFKAPFRSKFKKEDSGIKIVSTQLQDLQSKNIRISAIVILGPLLNRQNKQIKAMKLEKTFQEQYYEIVKNFRIQLRRINQQVPIYILPSVQDILSLYPIPQPPCPLNIDPKDKNIMNLLNTKFLPNPGFLQVNGRMLDARINVINYDLLEYFHKCHKGKSVSRVQHDDFESYLKQTFIMTNTLHTEQSFDQVNIQKMYNKGDFGDIVVFSSKQYEPFAEQVNGRLVVNIGSLGVESHKAGGHYMMIATMFEGEGSVIGRTKIQSIQMSI